VPCSAPRSQEWLAVLLDRQRGNRERAEAKSQRRHDREERRYQDRLDAYAAFEAVMVDKVRALAQFEERNPGLTPGAMGYEEREIAAVTDALVRVQLLASPEAEAAATALAALMPRYVYGSLSYAELVAAWEPFRAAARADLAGRPD
jgi:hypothetical protein